MSERTGQNDNDRNGESKWKCCGESKSKCCSSSHVRRTTYVGVGQCLHLRAHHGQVHRHLRAHHGQAQRHEICCRKRVTRSGVGWMEKGGSVDVRHLFSLPDSGRFFFMQQNKTFLP